MSRRNALEIVATVLTRFGGKSVNLLVFVTVAHKLTLEEMAVYGAIFSVTLIYSAVLDLGVRNSLAVFVGRNPDDCSGYTRSAFMLWLLLAASAFPIMYFTVESARDPQILASSGLLLTAMLYLRMMQGTLLGQGQIGLFNKTELASRLVLLAGTGIIVSIPDAFSLVSALWVLAVSQFVAAFYLFLYQRSAILYGRSGDRGIAWRLVSRGFVFMLSVLLMHASKRAAFLIVSQLSSAEEAAAFFTLQRLTEVMTEVGMAVSVVMFSRNVRAVDPAVAARETAQASRLTLMILAIIAGGFGVFSKWLVPLALGDQYSGNDPLFHALLLATLVGAVWVMLFPSMSVATSPLRVFLIMLPGTIINMILAYALADQFGSIGAAWAMLISGFVTTTLFTLTYRKKYGTGLLDFVLIKRSDLSGVLERVRKKAR